MTTFAYHTLSVRVMYHAAMIVYCIFVAFNALFSNDLSVGRSVCVCCKFQSDTFAYHTLSLRVMYHAAMIIYCIFVAFSALFSND